MPINYKEYPANWKTEIRPAVMQRAGEVREAGKITTEAKCEGCGVVNHSVFTKINGEKVFLQHAGGSFYLCPDGLKRWVGRTGNWKLVRVILTVAHLDHDKTNEDVQLERLRAWCQACHLNYDRDRHRENFRNNRAKKTGQQSLF